MILPALLGELDGMRDRGLGTRIGAHVRAGADRLWPKRNGEGGGTVDQEETRAIVERALAGEGEAFASLFGEYQRDVIRVCRRMLGDAQSAEDASSEVFLRARRSLPSFDPGRPFRPWLVAIAGHYCIDQLRQRASEDRVFSGSEAQESDLASPGPSPLAALMAAEQRRAVEEAIASLPIRYRLPLLLRYFDDMDYDAIAQSIGVTRNQVGTLLFRGKRLLREAVVENTGEPASRAGRRSKGSRRGARKRARVEMKGRER